MVFGVEMGREVGGRGQIRIYKSGYNSSSTSFTSDASVRNLGVTFDPHLSFSNHISNLSRSCFMHIRDLRRIRPMLDFKTASTIATSIVHSKLDYCNSLFLS